MPRVNIALYPMRADAYPEGQPLRTEVLREYVKDVNSEQYVGMFDRHQQQWIDTPLQDGACVMLSTAWDHMSPAERDATYDPQRFVRVFSGSAYDVQFWDHPFFKTEFFKELARWVDMLFATGALTFNCDFPVNDWLITYNSTLARLAMGRNAYLGYVSDAVNALMRPVNKEYVPSQIAHIARDYCGLQLSDGDYPDGLWETVETLITQCFEGERESISREEIIEACSRQMGASAAMAQRMHEKVLAGEIFGHNVDVVQRIVTTEIPKRALGVEMELVIQTDGEGETEQKCEHCDGTGEYEDDETGDIDECAYCYGDGTRLVYHRGPSRGAVLKSVAQEMPPHTYLPKRDGSISEDYGVEFVTVPMYKLDLFAWLDKFCEVAARNSFDGDEECGMHIHLSRGWFSSKAHLARFYGLAHGPLRRIIERYVGPERRAMMREWAHVDEDEWRKIIRSGTICGAHYDGVSLDGTHTVEVRFFAGTVDALVAKANVELMLSMVNYATPASGGCLYPYRGTAWADEHYETSWTTHERRYLEWLWEHRKDYKFLMEHLQKHPDIGQQTQEIAETDKQRRAALAAAKKAKKEALRKKEGELLCV